MGGPSAARSRIDLLLDPGSFLELNRMAPGLPPGDGVIAGLGTIDGR